VVGEILFERQVVGEIKNSKKPSELITVKLLYAMKLAQSCASSLQKKREQWRPATVTI